MSHVVWDVSFFIYTYKRNIKKITYKTKVIPKAFKKNEKNIKIYSVENET